MCITYRYGSFNSHTLLLAGHLRNEVVTVVDFTCQLRELRTITDKVRPHGDGNVDRCIFVIDSFHQQVDEGQRFIYRARIGTVFKTKELFKLIYQH